MIRRGEDPGSRSYLMERVVNATPLSLLRNSAILVLIMTLSPLPQALADDAALSTAPVAIDGVAT